MMDEKVMLVCRFYCCCLRVARRLAGAWRDGPNREQVNLYLVSYAYKKAARPSHIAGAEVLENTYRKATYKWSRRYTMMTAHGIPKELPTNRQKPQKRECSPVLYDVS